MPEGRFKNHVVITETVSMSTATQTRNEIQIPNFGDIYAVEVDITQSTSGTLSSANTLDFAISSLVVKDKSGNQLLQNIRGKDLLFLERNRMKGNNRTIATTSGSGQTEQFFIPLNVESKDQEARVQLAVAPYSDMASSGATAGSLTYSIIVWYYDKTENVRTEKIQRITKSVISGANTFGIDIPKSVDIIGQLFKIGTEGNITSIDFSADGNKEMNGVTPANLKAIDNAMLIDGHVTGEFNMYIQPYRSSPATRFDITGAGSDTLELFVINLN